MKKLFSASFSLLALLALSGQSFAQKEAVAEPKAIVPTKKIEFLKDPKLPEFYTWLTDTHYEDPRGVFKMQPDGTLRISGDGFGGLTTKDEYADYYLVLEYRWGTETFLSRKEKSRDGGLLLHCKGPDGNLGGSPGKPGPWMASIEFQIIEGGTGDILVLDGKDQEGKIYDFVATVRSSKDRDGENVFDPKAEPVVFQKGRINWWGRDPDWKDVLGFRGKQDVESPGQEWTKLECYAKGGTLTYLVNGVVVNRATDVAPHQGKILLQTEGAEMFVRKFELNPLPAEIP